MKRRDFVKGLLGGAAAAVAGPLVAGQESAAPPPAAPAAAEQCCVCGRPAYPLVHDTGTEVNRCEMCGGLFCCGGPFFRTHGQSCFQRVDHEITAGGGKESIIVRPIRLCDVCRDADDVECDTDEDEDDSSSSEEWSSSESSLSYLSCYYPGCHDKCACLRCGFRSLMLRKRK